MRVILAPDKFKGSLSAAGVIEHLTAGLRAARPGLDVVPAPVADGGDGTLEAALTAGFTRVPVRAAGPAGEPVDSAIAVRGEVAVIELAAVAGLVLMPGGRLDPLRATSYGVGDLIRAALDAGCREVVLGVGGSASTDGGAGMLQALGARLLDAAGAALPPGGAALGQLDRLDLSGLDPRLSDVQMVLASDVDNPLLGARGAAAVYGPQKGATRSDIDLLDAALTGWAQLVDPAAADLPGAGAAGGVGYGALAVLGARARPGIDVVLELIGFHELVTAADLVVTGEGALDAQTLHGKAPAGVAAASRAVGVPVVAVCGRLLLDDEALASAGIRAAYALTDVEPDIDRCIAEPGPLLELLAREIAEQHLPGAPR